LAFPDRDLSFDAALFRHGRRSAATIGQLSLAARF